MSLLLGEVEVTELFLGDVALSKLMLGTVQVWPTGAAPVTGALAAIEAPDVAALVGTITAPVAPITGTIAAVEAADTAAIVAGFAPAGSFAGAIAASEDDDTAAIAGTVTTPVYTGTIVTVEDDDASSIAGTVAAPVYTGTIGAVEADDIAAIVGDLTFTGTVAVVAASDVAAVVATFSATAAVFTDNFNRANTAQGGMGVEWFAPNWQISTNRANRPSGGTGDFGVFKHDVGSPDMWVEADCDPSGNVYSVINLRRPSGTDDATNGVGYIGYLDIGTLKYTIAKSTPSFTLIATGTTGSAGGGAFKLRLEAQGTALRLYVNGTLNISTTDSAITTGNFAGINGSSGAFVDNFRCGALPWTP